MSYPRSNPVYNISATLTHVTKVNGSRYLPFCISTLIVQPYNESKLELVPFNVSCQTYCEDENRTGICKTKSYKVATGMSQWINYMHP